MGNGEGAHVRRSYYAGITGLAVFVFTAMPLAAQSNPRPNLSPDVQRRQLERAARAAAKLLTKPTVTCGMTVVPADPKVDPKAIKPVPDQATKHTIRQVPPAACR